MIREFPTATAAGTGGASKQISLTGHGYVVGNVLRFDVGVTPYVKALSDTAANAEVTGMVSEVVSADMFILTQVGWVEHITSPAVLVPGTTYGLSDVTPGLIVATDPPEGTISKPLFIATGVDEGFFFNFRGTEVTSSTMSYYKSFTDGDLVAGILTVTHNLGHEYCSVTVFDNNKKIIIPGEVLLTGVNTLTIDLSAEQAADGGAIAGTWKVVLLDVGTPWAISSVNSVLKIADYIILDNDTWDTIFISGNTTITLPVASVKRRIRLAKSDSSATTAIIARAGADTIEGATSVLLVNQYDTAEFESDGITTWFSF